MPKRTQDKFKVAAKVRLLELDLTVTELATRIGKARNTVSMAINHPVFPTVRERIAKELKLKPEVAA